MSFISAGKELSQILEDNEIKNDRIIERVPLLEANIHINGSIKSTAKLVINEGDDPRQIVSQFCKKYSKYSKIKL